MRVCLNEGERQRDYKFFFLCLNKITEITIKQNELRKIDKKIRNHREVKTKQEQRRKFENHTQLMV